MEFEKNINGVHYLNKNKNINENTEFENLKEWIYINFLINNYVTNKKSIELILKEIIYDIKIIENEVLKKKIMTYLPSYFLKYKKYNKKYPII